MDFFFDKSSFSFIIRTISGSIIDMTAKIHNYLRVEAVVSRLQFGQPRFTAYKIPSNNQQIQC